jgi:hypothetical protein
VETRVVVSGFALAINFLGAIGFFLHAPGLFGGLLAMLLCVLQLCVAYLGW